MNRETFEFYLVYLLDSPFNPAFNINIQQLKELLISWNEIQKIIKNKTGSD